MGLKTVGSGQKGDQLPAQARTASFSAAQTVLETRPLEFRWHGRGGQGVVTASRILAEAALRGGFYPQSLPDFGAERSGAPLVVYTRISRTPLSERGHVSEPDVVVVLDSSLLGRVDVTEGMRDGGVIVVSTRLSPKELSQHLSQSWRLACTVEGTAIALQLLGRNIPNVPVLGALLKAVPILPLEVIKEALRERFEQRFSKRVLEANLQALERGFAEAVIEGAS